MILSCEGYDLVDIVNDACYNYVHCEKKFNGRYLCQAFLKKAICCGF